MTVQKSIKFSDGTEIHFCRTEEKPEQPDAVEFYDVDGNRLDICLGDIMRLQDDDQRKHEWYAEIQKRMVDSMRRTAWENGL